MFSKQPAKQLATCRGSLAIRDLLAGREGASKRRDKKRTRRSRDKNHGRCRRHLLTAVVTQRRYRRYRLTSRLVDSKTHRTKRSTRRLSVTAESNVSMIVKILPQNNPLATKLPLAPCQLANRSLVAETASRHGKMWRSASLRELGNLVASPNSDAKDRRDLLAGR